VEPQNDFFLHNYTDYSFKFGIGIPLYKLYTVFIEHINKAWMYTMLRRMYEIYIENQKFVRQLSEKYFYQNHEYEVHQFGLRLLEPKF
jgi:hypothetical protein